MKYIGVDASGIICYFKNKPKWRTSAWLRTKGEIGIWLIPQGVLPPLEPCCLYRIDKDCYTLIEDRRKKDESL